MKFARIEMLFLIWAVPLCFLICLYGNKRRKKILETFSSHRGLKSIVPLRGDSRRWLKSCLVLAALAVMAVALSGPQYGYKWQETRQRGVDIVIALDCSKSMLAGDIKPSRLERAKRKIYDLLTILEGDRVGLVAFAGTAFLQCPLTLDYDAFHIFLQTLTPDYLPVGGTDLSGAILTSLSAFDEKITSEKAVILITDGENTGEDDPVKAAEQAQKAGVKVFCIGVGSEGGVPVPDREGGLKKDKNGQIVVTRLDEESLKKMAVLTGGTYVRSVSGDMDLEVIYKQEIRGKMEQATLASGRRQVWEDRFQWVLIFAVVLLAVELFLSPAEKKASVFLLFVLLSMPHGVYADAMREGVEAYDKGEYEKSLKLFIDAQLDDPDNPKILYNIGNAYYKLENYESAVQNYTQSLEKQKEDNQLKAKTLYNLGNANFRLQKFDEAIKNYEAALKITPEDSQVQQNMEIAKKAEEMVKKQKEQQKQGDDQGKKEDQEKKDGENQEQGDKDKDKKDQEKKEGEDSHQNTTDGDQKKKDGENRDGKTGDQEQDQPENQEKQGKNPENKDQEKPSPEFDKEKKDEENQASPGEKKDGESKEAGAAKPGTPSEGKDSQNGDQQQQVEKMLNRLKDEPGKAMIPVYRERHVEKDW